MGSRETHFRCFRLFRFYFLLFSLPVFVLLCYYEASQQLVPTGGTAHETPGRAWANSREIDPHEMTQVDFFLDLEELI